MKRVVSTRIPKNHDHNQDAQVIANCLPRVKTGFMTRNRLKTASHLLMYGGKLTDPILNRKPTKSERRAAAKKRRRAKKVKLNRGDLKLK